MMLYMYKDMCVGWKYTGSKIKCRVIVQSGKSRPMQ